MDFLSHLFEQNRAWAAEMTRQDPEFFARLCRQQSPRYLWIGCSDSRVPANQIVGIVGVHLTPLLHESGNLGRITALVVEAGHRGQGIGSLLVSEAEFWAWNHSCSRMEVTSGDHRSDAHRFYEACGYRCDERRFPKRRKGGQQAPAAYRGLCGG